jgi:hypothetical protein
MGWRGGSKVWLRMRGLRPPPEKVAVPHFPDLWKRLDGHKLVPVNLHTYPLRSALLRTGAMACDMSPNRGAIHDAGKVRRAVA